MRKKQRPLYLRTAETMEEVTLPKSLLLDLLQIKERFEPLAPFATPELRSVVEDCTSKIGEIATTAGVCETGPLRKKTRTQPQKTNQNPGPSSGNPGTSSGNNGGQGTTGAGRPKEVKRRTRRPSKKLCSGTAPRPPPPQQVKHHIKLSLDVFICILLTESRFSHKQVGDFFLPTRYFYKNNLRASIKLAKT